MSKAPETDVRESNPSAAGPRGLEGDLGISSERTGPQGAGPTGAPGSIEGTGSHGTSNASTDGVMTTTPREHPEDPAEGADPDAPAGPDQPREHPQEPAEGQDDHAPVTTGDFADDDANVDRTVGEPQPAPVRNKHEFDPARNPGHLGG